MPQTPAKTSKASLLQRRRASKRRCRNKRYRSEVTEYEVTVSRARYLAARRLPWPVFPSADSESAADGPMDVDGESPRGHCRYQWRQRRRLCKCKRRHQTGQCPRLKPCRGCGANRKFDVHIVRRPQTAAKHPTSLSHKQRAPF